MIFLIGFLSGIVSGMGIGGGTIMIPALVFFAGTPQQIAQSVNLLFFIPTAIMAITVHIKNKNIDFKLAIPIIIAGLVGAYFGSQLAISLPGLTLKKWFGFFLLGMGLYEMFRGFKKRS